MFSIAVDLFFGLKVLNAAHVYCASGAFSTKVSAALSQKRDFSFFFGKGEILQPTRNRKKEKKGEKIFFLFLFFCGAYGIACFAVLFYFCLFVLLFFWVLCAKA